MMSKHFEIQPTKTIYSAINEKRNSVQNEMKSAWERTYHVCLFIIQNIDVIVIL